MVASASRASVNLLEAVVDTPISVARSASLNHTHRGAVVDTFSGGSQHDPPLTAPQGTGTRTGVQWWTPSPSRQTWSSTLTQRVEKVATRLLPRSSLPKGIAINASKGSCPEAKE